MKNQIQIFDCMEFGKIEVLFDDSKPFFPATECAAILGYSNPHDAVLKHCRYLAKREVPHPQNPHKKISRNFIPEGDLYRLIARSKLPAAERFEKIVFDEILPSIRKHGIFVTPEVLDEMLNSRQYAEDLLNQLRVGEERIFDLETENLVLETENLELETEINELESVNRTLAPKASYCDMVLRSGDAVQVSIIAKDYGRSAASFNKLLHAVGIQFKIGETWLTYQKYTGKGYTKTKTYYIKGRVASISTLWTQRGRMFIYEKLKSYGILPLVEMR